MTITGTNFTGATAVSFGGTAAASFAVVSATSITATSPAHAAGAVDVTVTTPNGTSATSASDTFTYAAAPTVSAVNPNAGPIAGGTSVTITGTNFTGATAVSFGGTAAASFAVVSATSITATSPAHAAGAVDVTVTTPNGTSATSASDTFTYAAAPTVSAVNPNAGPIAGGTSVTITGTNFTGATAVSFGGTAATSFAVVSATSITATSPAHAAGAVDVTVTTPNGTSATSASDTFTYAAGSPITMGETTITPNSDSGNANLLLAQQASLSQTATIQSMSFYVTAAAGKLRLGIYNATGPGGGPGTKIAETAEITPVVGWNTANVTSQVSLPAGTYWLAYLPSSNSLGFRNAQTGSTKYYSLTYGALPTTFSTAPNSGTFHFSFYATLIPGVANTPTVSAVNPNAGPIAGGTSVTITGTNFTGATAVSFGGTAAASFAVVSATSITATSPAHAAGAVDVTVTTPNGTSATSASDTFTYAAAPTVSAVNPNAGPIAGGTSVTITGTNFTGATAVSFGGTAAASFAVVSATSITATSPAHAAGAVDVTVTTPNGTSATSASDTFTYAVADTVPPTVPTNLTATAISSTQINLTWTASTDNVGVTGYQIFRNGVQVGTSATNSYSDSGLTASTTYTYTVSAYDAAGNVSAQSSAANATTLAMGTPGFVQHVSFQSNENFENGNAFVYNLPNAVLSGNCVIVSLTFAYSASRTVAITDNNGGNTWTQLATVNNTGQGLTSRTYASFNTAAGTSQITVTFDAALQGVQANISEFYNIAISNATDGSHTASSVATSGSIASGSFNTTVNGDLIYQFGANTTFGTQLADHPTNFTPGSGFAPLVMDHSEGTFIQWQAQSSFGATNPGFISSDGGGGTYNSITVALKSASAGTAPSATAIRIANIFHTRISTYPLANNSSANFTAQFPTTGNLFVLSTAYDELQEKVNSVSDSINGSWNVVTGTGVPQFAYKQNATPGALTLTVNLTELGSGNLQVLFYDVVNADTAASPVIAYNTGGAVSAGGNVTPAPTIIPATANGLVIATVGLYTGPPNTLSSPTGVIFELDVLHRLQRLITRQLRGWLRPLL